MRRLLAQPRLRLERIPDAREQVGILLQAREHGATECGNRGGKAGKETGRGAAESFENQLRKEEREERGER